MTTAPNSLIPLPNIRMKPDSILFQASGREMVKNTRIGEAPKVSAAFSSRTGTASNPSRAELIRKGILTNAIAMAMPIGCPTRFNPNEAATLPMAESLVIKPRIAIPAAE